MKKNEIFSEVAELLMNRRLGKAIEMLEAYLLSHPRQNEMEQLNSLKNDYQLMTDYWRKGFADPQRNQLYNQLLRRLYVLSTNIGIHDQIRNSSFLSTVYARPRNARKDWSMQKLRLDLENYVTDVAMLSLEEEKLRQQKEPQLQEGHLQMMNDLFDYIWTSRLWKDSLANAFKEMLLSPTIDVRDQQLMVSAIMLSGMNNFDINKLKVLIHVYQNAADEQLRQRALVGWVFCIDADKSRLYLEQHHIIKELCEDERTRRELTELQMQVLLCMSTDEDARTIHNEIMPEIMKGNNLRITRNGIKELDEDTLANILHPEAEEQNMERMEASMRRMVDMQKQGSDIYFGGFSQMKRFTFFQQISNWFVPFYPEHPGISQIWQQEKGKRFLHTITALGAFCDSDKYSFVLAFNHVLSHLPQQMLSLVEQGDASPMPIGGEVALEDQRKPAFIRRLYLQNLYRFFRLYGQRENFANPFDDGQCVFFANKLFHDTPLVEAMLSIASFLSKHRQYAEAMSVLDNIDEQHHHFEYHMLMAHLLMRSPQNYATFTLTSATDHYREALQLEPDNRKALMGFARACFAEQRYQQSLEAYQKLMNMEPEESRLQQVQLNAAVCMVYLKQYDEALKLLYKLNYLTPDDEDVMRVLAWCLTVDKKYEQAAKLYNKLLSAEKPHTPDMLNYGYCLWFSGDVVSAVGMLRQFLSDQKDPQFSIEQELMVTERELIGEQGIDDVEIQLMLDQLNG